MDTTNEDSPSVDNFMQEIADFSDTNLCKLRGEFYSVFIPQDLRQKGSQASKHIFNDKVEAMKIVKKTKRARFKHFEYFHEALKFATVGSLQSPHIINGSINKTGCANPPIVGEKPSPFKGPKPQEFVKLRKSIETGDIDYFKQAVWENPRYLVSSGDTPSILQEGFRYNALHVAAKAKNAVIADLILSTISNPKFVSILYGDDQNENIESRMQVLVDLYLNTPDKGLNETPLHFATKYGAADVVEVLVTFPECDKTLKNKYGQTPDMIICDRCDNKEEIKVLKKKISMHLENCYYVPVLRADDNSVAPQVGDPFSPGKAPIINKNPLSPRLEIHAYAGPMSKEGAEQFRKVWKTPPRTSTPISKKTDDTLDSVVSLRYTDLTKGLERFGQKLASMYKVSWKEYWSFLDYFIDITSDEGLVLLECYLVKRITSLDRSYSCSPPPQDETSKRNTNSISDLCEQMRKCNLHDESVEESKINVFLCVEKACYVFATRIAAELYNRTFENFHEQITLLEIHIRQIELLILSYWEDSRFSRFNFSQLHPRLGLLICEKIGCLIEKSELPAYVDVLTTFVADCLRVFDGFSSDDEGNCFRESKPTSLKKQLLCLMQNVVENFYLEHVSPPVELYEESSCREAWSKTKECQCLFNTKRQRRSLVTNRNNSKRPAKVGAMRRTVLFPENRDAELTEDSSGDEDFFTPPASPTPMCVDDDDEEEEFDEAPLMTEIFLEDVNPTKTDCALFKALQYSNRRINSDKYPSIYRWYHNVNLYSEVERESWPRPKKKKLEDTEICSTPSRNSPTISVHSPSNYWLRITGANSPRASLQNKINL